MPRKSNLKRYYLAYGSNLNINRLKERCKKPITIGSIILPNFRLSFRDNNNGNIYATIEKAKGFIVPLGVFEITEDDESVLDRSEGTGIDCYKKVEFKKLSDPSLGIFKGFCYLMPRGRDLGTPSEEYVNIIREGYKKFGFDETILDEAIKYSKANSRLRGEIKTKKKKMLKAVTVRKKQKIKSKIVPSMNYKNLREEPLKSQIQEDLFSDFKYTQIGNVDFVIAEKSLDNTQQNLKSILWAEAKPGITNDIFESFVQLILTIGKEKLTQENLPPKYVGAFDAEKMAFIEFHYIQHIFSQNDFNWNVAPSNHRTKEFKLLYDLCKNTIKENKILFYYDSGFDELKDFIKINFLLTKVSSEKISITKNNFTFVFQKWLKQVMPSIDVDWEAAKKEGLIPADFYLADLLSDDNSSLSDNLFIVLRKTIYHCAKKIDETRALVLKCYNFKDGQKAYRDFWSIYKRPPKEEYWNYILERRDLLVPPDIRERKGSFFTPEVWVEKSQQYIADVLGENWQDEYVIWDCCAGTGNLLNGLTNYRNVWASTLDRPDVDVMKDQIRSDRWKMFENHIFQFDFLNDEFKPISDGGTLPDDLYNIISNENKRKKLVIYINPPYAEADNRKGEGRKGVNKNKTRDKYSTILKKAQRELFALFLTRIYYEIPGCFIAQFSKLKHLQAANFKDFRYIFKAKLQKSFIVPGNTFDNVTGQFPIGFFIWNLSQKEVFTKTITDVYDENNDFIGHKELISYDNTRLINDWIDTFRPGKNAKDSIATMIGVASDFQNQRLTRIERPYMKVPADNHNWQIVTSNLIPSSVYLAVRWCMTSNWINDRDQFLYPNDLWKTDKEFQTDCLIFTIFHFQNHISCFNSENNWIPFTENQVGCKNAFKSNFMSRFLNGKISIKREADLFTEEKTEKIEILMSKEAKSVYNAGLELWKYYHKEGRSNPDASLYDIKKFFQGESDGRMNSYSNDEKYMKLISDLRYEMRRLALKIQPKVFEYGFFK